MAAMTVADESLYALPLQRLNVFAASRDRQRRMTSDRGAAPSYFAATSTSGLDIERKDTCSVTGNCVSVAQWLGRRTSDLAVMGSIPAPRVIRHLGQLAFIPPW